MLIAQEFLRACDLEDVKQFAKAKASYEAAVAKGHALAAHNFGILACARPCSRFSSCLHRASAVVPAQPADATGSD